MEAFGKHKRDILVERVSNARDSQTEAKEQFKNALEEFSSVLNFEGGELEEKYNKLNAEYQKSEAKANAVRNRIKDVKNVATALFREWAGWPRYRLSILSRAPVFFSVFRGTCTTTPSRPNAPATSAW